MEGIFNYPRLLLMIGILLGVQLVQSTNISNKIIARSNECPTWFFWNKTSRQCECPTVYNIKLHCNKTNNHTLLHWSECVTYDSATQTISFGLSPFASLLAANGEESGRYSPLPKNRSELNEFMCGGANREGLLCSKCRPGYGPSVSSYDHKCAKCSHTYSGWILYFSVTLIPTTVFFVIIVVCQVRTTAAPLNMFILTCQLVAVSISLYDEYNQRDVMRMQSSDTVKIIYGTAVTLITSWNLDYFRLLIPPFCVIENLSIIQVLCMDYIIAFYPLLLTVIMYVCIQQHARGSRLLVCAWRPFGYCFAPLVRRFNWNPATSIVHIFASFLLLSSTKILFVSTTLLGQHSLTNITETGTIHSIFVFYYDPKHVVFGQSHRPYAVLAILVSTVFVALPCLLLILYPFSFFQKCLNHCGVTWHAVHAFADAFNGCYKDGTNGTCDCRSFAGFFLLLRILYFITIPFSNQHMRDPMIGTGIVLLSVFSVVCPYKNRLCNILDSVVLTVAVCRYCLLDQYKHILNIIIGVYFFVYFVLFVSCKIIFKFNCCCSQKLKVLADKLAGSRASTSSITHMKEVGDTEENLPDRLVNPEGYRLVSEENMFQSLKSDIIISTYGSIH